MAADAFLSVEDLWVDYGGGPVVRGINLHVDRGEILALLGANGAGKTSALLSTFGLIPRKHGTIRIAGKTLIPFAAERSASSGLALVPDNRGIFPKMTVMDHVWLGCHRRPRREDMNMIATLFPALMNRLNSTAGSLSGGEAQMLAVAVGLLARPAVLLIDELSFGLAPTIVTDLLGVCRRLAAEQDMAIILVEQYVELALRTADRVAVMAGGRLVLEGAAADFVERRDEIHSAYMSGTGSVTAGPR